MFKLPFLSHNELAYAWMPVFVVILSCMLFHSLADIVLQGHILSSRQGEFGLYIATVSYTYAYKHDGQLARSSWTRTDVINFPFDPTKPEYSGNTVFFLIRQQNMDLSLYCMSSLKTLRNINADRFAEVRYVSSHIRKIGTSKLHNGVAIALKYNLVTERTIN